MRRPTRTTLRALRTSVMLARPGDVSALPTRLRHLVSREEGMATAEYAIGTLAAVTEGRRTLLIDLDPQGNATMSAAKDTPTPEDVGVADALSERSTETLESVIVPGVWDGLDVAPTPPNEALTSVRNELLTTQTPGVEHRLSEAVASVADRYDLVLIDCPPSLDHLTLNGLVAADRVAIVTQAKVYSIAGLGRLLQTIVIVRKYYNPQLAVAGVIVNQYEAQTIGARSALEDLEKIEGLTILDPPIPKRAVIADALEAATGLDQWGGKDAAELADLYRQHLDTITKGAIK